MIIRRQFLASGWNKNTASVVLDYLMSRGFSDAQVEQVSSRLIITGTRGGWIGNLTSFDMSKLRSRIEVVGDASGLVHVDLKVSTFGQQITEWNRAYWRLELVELCSVVLGRGRIADVWARYAGPRRQAAVLWTLFGMFFGRRLSDDWRSEIGQLEKCFLDERPASSCRCSRRAAQNASGHFERSVTAARG